MADQDKLQQRQKELAQPDNETPVDTLIRASRKQEAVFKLQDTSARTAHASASTSIAKAREAIQADSQRGRSKPANKEKTKQATEDAKSAMAACLKIARQDPARYQRWGGLKKLREQVRGVRRLCETECSGDPRRVLGALPKRAGAGSGQ